LQDRLGGVAFEIEIHGVATFALASVSIHAAAHVSFLAKSWIRQSNFLKRNPTTNAQKLRYWIDAGAEYPYSLTIATAKASIWCYE